MGPLYAIVEAASETLEIAREDIGGSLTPSGADRWSITLFDAVPGGAGHVLQVEENLERVLRVALRRVSDCECGPETSCYGCLRSYQNQRDHDYLSRGAAEQVLRRLVENEGAVDVQITEAAVPDSLPPDWVPAYRSAVGSERDMVLALAEAGVIRPELGFESAGGIPISVAWPDRLIAASLGLRRPIVQSLRPRDGRCSRWRRCPHSSRVLKVGREHGGTRRQLLASVSACGRTRAASVHKQESLGGVFDGYLLEVQCLDTSSAGRTCPQRFLMNSAVDCLKTPPGSTRAMHSNRLTARGQKTSSWRKRGICCGRSGCTTTSPPGTKWSQLCANCDTKMG
ncbi:DUF1998 domain-containing protein [Mycobacterium sp. 2YAF39]|uniref:DUF1998 domain-containing protein n=1 Tax=Mycobacterium sp. 2YAF39 TaxID=3233033 RepID=UPI003F9D2E51